MKNRVFYVYRHKIWGTYLVRSGRSGVYGLITDASCATTFDAPTSDAACAFIAGVERPEAYEQVRVTIDVQVVPEPHLSNCMCDHCRW